MAKIGLKNFYYAVATENPSTGALTYAQATKPAKAISFSFEPSVSNATLYADDAIAEQDTSVTGGTCTMGVDRLDEATLSALLGHTLATSGGEETSNTDDVAPYVGLGRVVTLMLMVRSSIVLSSSLKLSSKSQVQATQLRARLLSSVLTKSAVLLFQMQKATGATKIPLTLRLLLYPIFLARWAVQPPRSLAEQVSALLFM